MLDLKKLLGDKYKEELTDAEKLALLNELNLADLSSGEYVAKGKFDARESEIAKLQKRVSEFEQKELDSLTDAQKQDVAFKKLQESNDQLAKEIARFKLKETIMSDGFTAEECNKIIEAQDKGENVSSVYAEIMKSRTEAAVKSAKAESIKNGTPPPPMGGDDVGNDGSDDDEAVKYAKSLAQENTLDTKSIDSIKSSYSVSDIR